MISAEESGLQPPPIPTTTTESAATETQATGVQSTTTSTTGTAGSATTTTVSSTQQISSAGVLDITPGTPGQWVGKSIQVRTFFYPFGQQHDELH